MLNRIDGNRLNKFLKLKLKLYIYIKRTLMCLIKKEKIPNNKFVELAANIQDYIEKGKQLSVSK
jgi:hypothetical protein